MHIKPVMHCAGQNLHLQSPDDSLQGQRGQDRGTGRGFPAQGGAGAPLWIPSFHLEPKGMRRSHKATTNTILLFMCSPAAELLCFTVQYSD
jgi:hypothetical protein